jgi:hypothetical protein
VRDHSGAVQTLAQLNRDRGGRPATRVVERLRLLLDHAPQLVQVEVALVAGCRQHPPDRARDCSHPGATGRELPPGIE